MHAGVCIDVTVLPMVVAVTVFHCRLLYLLFRSAVLIVCFYSVRNAVRVYIVTGHQQIVHDSVFYSKENENYRYAEIKQKFRTNKLDSFLSCSA